MYKTWIELAEQIHKLTLLHINAKSCINNRVRNSAHRILLANNGPDA